MSRYGIGRDAFNQGKNAQYKPAIEEELQPTLVAKGPGAVADPVFSSSKASFFTEAEEEMANTLVATDYKDPPLVNDSDGLEYIVRRLTPTECARLQGFPDWWCSDLGTEHPTDAEVYEWYKIFETHRRITGSSGKSKSDKQIREFLKNPHSDSAEYKMWGTLTKRTEDIPMTELQNYIDNFGFGISVQNLCSKAYWQMKADGHEVCIINDRYLELDGKTYLFSKSRKNGRWIAKEF